MAPRPAPLIRTWACKGRHRHFSAAATAHAGHHEKTHQLLRLPWGSRTAMNADTGDGTAPNAPCTCRLVSTHLNGRRDALAFPPQARAFPPAHGLQHLVADVTVVKAIFGGLLIIAAGRREELPDCSSGTEAKAEELSDTYTVPAS